jgi:tetratricopeptide (TPR) repeat protein
MMYSGFVLLSFLLYLRGDLAFSFLCGVLSKEPAVLLPALVILDHWLFRRWEKQKILRWILGACLILFVYFVLRWNAIGPVWKLAREVPMGLFEQIISGTAFAGLYVLKFLFPSELNVYYDYSLPLSLQVLAAGYAVVVCVLILTYLCRKQRSVLFGFGWFFLFLSPALILRAVSASLFAERYLYLSSAGLLLAFFSFPLRKQITAAVLCLAVVLSWISFERARIWKDDLTLWTDSVEKSPNVSAVTYNLATAYVHQKRWEEAAVWFARTIELKKDMPAAYFNLAICRYNLGDRESAKRTSKYFFSNGKEASECVTTL